MAENEWEHNTTGYNTTLISQILNRLTDKSKYDKRLRPRYGEGHVDVGITVHVSTISKVSEVDMDFTLDFYLRQTWNDPRLAFGKMNVGGFEKIKFLTVGVDYLERLWKPDTFFPNEKKSFFHSATTHNSFLRIDPDGRVSTSQRLTVTASCPMQLRLFPMDSQTCKLEIESYGYTTDDISYYWGDSKKGAGDPKKAVAFGDFALPQFRRTGFRVNSTTAVTSSGAYDRLYFEVILSRNLGFYLMNIIIPSMLIVSISWVSFWVSREASPARVGLGTMTVLTMTTLITTTNNSMPKVSYIKGLDVFLNFCFVMVFASLVEYAIVSYTGKRMLRRKEKYRKRPNRPTLTSYPTTPNGGLAVPPSPKFIYPSNGTPTFSLDGDIRKPLHAQMSNGSSIHQPMHCPQSGWAKPLNSYCKVFSPSRIDHCSRSVFPLLFIGFNVVYWSIMTALSGREASEFDFVAFQEEI